MLTGLLLVLSLLSMLAIAYERILDQLFADLPLPAKKPKSKLF